MDRTIEFSASNKLNHSLERTSDGFGKHPWAGMLVLRIFFYVFDDSERVNEDTGKRMRPSDSARQVGLTTLWKEPLMAAEGIREHGY